MKTKATGTNTNGTAHWWIGPAPVKGHRYLLPINAWARETWTPTA